MCPYTHKEGDVRGLSDRTGVTWGRLIGTGERRVDGPTVLQVRTDTHTPYTHLTHTITSPMCACCKSLLLSGFPRHLARLLAATCDNVQLEVFLCINLQPVGFSHTKSISRTSECPPPLPSPLHRLTVLTELQNSPLYTH